MRLNTRTHGYLSLLTSTLLFAGGVWSKKDAPAIKSNAFDFMPMDVSYFEDSDVILFMDEHKRDAYRSANAGEKWEIVNGPKPGKLMELVMHPFDHKRAYYITSGKTHWYTTDRGETWKEFTTSGEPSIFRAALTFHAEDPDRIIFNARNCKGMFCDEETHYTIDHFKNTQLLRMETSGCYWAKSSERFTTHDKEMDRDRIICIARGKFSNYRKDFRLVISDAYFKKSGKDVQEFEPELESGRAVPGIVNMAIVKGYLVVAASAEGTDEMALYVSDDSKKWHRAVFPNDHKLTEKAYTILEGTNYSIQIDVMNSKPNRAMGVFLSSNSNGTYFTRNIENTNRARNGLVDFEKVTGIQGIVLVNVVDNFEDVSAKKKIKSMISFNDGRDFKPLKVKGSELHLHSVTELSNSGRVFSSPAPGLVMGCGNTGSHLKKYKDSNLYVSDDAGLTWSQALEGPHKYEFGDSGSILIAIMDDWTQEIKYSLNHGKDWNTVSLPHALRPVQLTTTQDSTSLKFLLEAVDAKDPKVPPTKAYLLALDFDDLHEAKCDADKDFEKWWARVDSEKKPICLMGHKQWYNRRKADSDCFVKAEFKDPEVHQQDCECTDDDFECDFNFERSKDRKECKLVGALVIPDGACKNSKDKFEGSSGWRKIPGNTCKGGLEKDKPVPRECSEGKSSTGPPATGKIKAHLQKLPGKQFTQLQYIERTSISAGDDETVLLRTDEGVFFSENHGKTWKNILEKEAITNIVPHPHFSDIVFFLTPTTKVFYSTDRGKTIRTFEAPYPPHPDIKRFEGIHTMEFHTKHKDWIIWIGGRDCPGDACHTEASLTKDRGDGPWKPLQRYVRKCEFIKESSFRYFDPEQSKKNKDKSKDDLAKARDKLIYCKSMTKETYDPKDNPERLVYSENFFEDFETPFPDVVDFATMAEFIVVATKDKKLETLKMDTSIDGQTFADAQFPHGFHVPHTQAFTVLDSSTHSVFVHVSVNTNMDQEYGTIIKSNSNGTSYVKTLDGVNRNHRGYVDFEKSSGIEGVAMVNIVTNYDDKSYAKDGKKVKTLMTHNDGAEWSYLQPPAKDAEGKAFGCSGALEKCSLHIHGYTQRNDKSHTFTSPSAIGLVFGTGNVGQFLTDATEDTFMSSDGGVSWKAVKKGKFQWRYGDQGSIVVIAKDWVDGQKRDPTKVVYYTLDEGETWEEHEFSSEGVLVDGITTVPSDSSRNFLLRGHLNGKLVTFNLDFSGLTDKQCKLDEGKEGSEGEDYYLWTPKHPNQDDDCLFGHVSQYHRKNIKSKCYNGRMIPHLHDIANNCTCTRRDFECDFNYQRQTDGSCALVPGFQPPDHSLICKEDDKAIEYYEPTGYRRIPITTCEGGKEMDKLEAKPCFGREDEFNKKHGPSGVVIFFAVIIPFILAGGIGYWVWKNWANNFGQIRLGEQSSFDSEAPYIKYPVLIVAGLVAILQALPLLASSLWRSASGALGRGAANRRFTTRDSFARGRGDYAVVDEDEGELLGEDSDEDV